jgi:thiol-disulfide isomerase/thioredoxin
VAPSSHGDAAGTLRTDQNQLVFDQGFSFSGYERDPLYLNLGTRKFLDISGVSGIDSITDGRAGVFADFDNDGDLDIFETTLQGPAHLLFRNNVGSANRHLRVSVLGDAETGRDAFGAVVRLRTSAGTLTKIKTCGSGYLSQHDPRLLFGLGQDATVPAIEVTWPGGRKETFPGPFQAGSAVVLRKGTAEAIAQPERSAGLPDPWTPAERFATSLRLTPGRPAPRVPLGSASSASTLNSLLRRGRRLLVNVWATWCVPCAREMPELERLRPQLAARGIDLVGLSVDTDVGVDVAAAARKLGATYPVFAGGEKAAGALYATDEITVPFSFLLTEGGTVLEILPGWSDESRRRFKTLAQGK